MATISYNMVTYGLPDVCTLTVPQSGLQPLGSGVCIRQTNCNCGYEKIYLLGYAT